MLCFPPPSIAILPKMYMCNIYMKNSKGFDIKGQRKRLDLGDLNRNMKGISTNAQSLD